MKAAGEDAKVVLAMFASEHEASKDDLDDRFIEYCEKVQSDFIAKTKRRRDATLGLDDIVEETET